MIFKKVLVSFVVYFVITLIVSSLVTYLYSLGFHDTAKIDWSTTFQLAVILGVIFPIMELRKEKPKG